MAVIKYLIVDILLKNAFKYPPLWLIKTIFWMLQPKNKKPFYSIFHLLCSISPPPSSLKYWYFCMKAIKICMLAWYMSYLCCLQAANEEGKTDWSMKKQYLCQAHNILQEIQESLQKREREVTELLQSERRFNKAMKPQMTVLIFLKSLIKMVRIKFLLRWKSI